MNINFSQMLSYILKYTKSARCNYSMYLHNSCWLVNEAHKRAVAQERERGTETTHSTAVGGGQASVAPLGVEKVRRAVVRTYVPSKQPRRSPSSSAPVVRILDDSTGLSFSKGIPREISKNGSSKDCVMKHLHVCTDNEIAMAYWLRMLFRGLRTNSRLSITCVSEEQCLTNCALK